VVTAAAPDEPEPERTSEGHDHHDHGHRDVWATRSGRASWPVGMRVEFVGTHISKAQELADELERTERSAPLRLSGEVAMLPVLYTEAPHVVQQYADQLEGKVIVDPTNWSTSAELNSTIRIGSARSGPARN
jgi:hypothetical protein